MKTNWFVKDSAVFGVSSVGSGQPADDKFYIQMEWSSKLGLTLAHAFNTKLDAWAVIEKILALGYISRLLWTPTFNPDSSWLNSSYSD